MSSVNQWVVWELQTRFEQIPRDRLSLRQNPVTDFCDWLQANLTVQAYDEGRFDIFKNVS